MNAFAPRHVAILAGQSAEAQKARAAANIQHHFACQWVSRLRIAAKMRVNGRPDKAQPNGV
jgi:hypothetical protein